MAMSFTSTRWIIRAGIVLAGIATTVAACVTDDHPRPKCNELADGGTVLDLPDASVYQGIPTTDAQAPRETAPVADRDKLFDPGPSCVDCQQANDVEVLLIHDFEQAFAPTWFNYAEPGVFIAPQQVGAGAQNDAGVPPPYWGLQVPDLNSVPGGMRCGSKYALHMAGGPFLTWGGGYVSLSVTVRGATNVSRFCPGDLSEDEVGIGTQPTSNGESCNFFITPVAGQPSRLGMDVSDYEGISFWARRSPGAQSTLRIAVNDENTSPGPALQAERKIDEGTSTKQPACRRALECCRHCVEVTRDAPIVGSGTERPIIGTQKLTEKRCHVEDELPPPDLQVLEDGTAQFRTYSLEVDEDAGTKEWVPGSWLPAGGYLSGLQNEWRAAYDAWDRDYKLCCPPTMVEEGERLARGDTARVGDPQFGGRECNPYVFQYDYSSGYYCWADGDPPLPERNENRCEDGFEANINVDTEWRFYMVPWSELRRLTPNRKAIDPTGIFSVALFFGQGYLDTYVDDIGFYRKRR
jgi:hypothetical protein